MTVTCADARYKRLKMQNLTNPNKFDAPVGVIPLEFSQSFGIHKKLESGLG